MMPIKRVTVERFETSDGQRYDTLAEAEVREAKITVAKLIDKSGMCKGGAWDASMIYDVLVNQASEFGPALNHLAIAQAARQKADGS